MAEYKQVDLQIGTEAQFETKKAELPVGTIVGITDPIHEEELDSDLQTAINSISNKLDKPSGNPTEDSLVKVSSTGSTSYKKLSELVNTTDNQTISGQKTFSSVLASYLDVTTSQNNKTSSVFIQGSDFIFKTFDDDNVIPEMRICNAPLFRGTFDDLHTQFPTFAQNPAAAPTVDSVTVYEATTAKPVWKPLSEITGGGSSVEVVQTTGDSTTAVMSQKAVKDNFALADGGSIKNGMFTGDVNLANADILSLPDVVYKGSNELTVPKQSGTFLLRPNDLPNETSVVTLTSTGGLDYLKIGNLVTVQDAQTIVGSKTFQSPVTAEQGVKANTRVEIGTSNTDKLWIVKDALVKYGTDGLFQTNKIPFIGQYEYNLALTPTTTPTVNSVVVTGTDNKPAWKPVSNFVDTSNAQNIAGLKTFFEGISVADPTTFLTNDTRVFFDATGISYSATGGIASASVYRFPGEVDGTLALRPNTLPTADSIVKLSSTGTPSYKPVSDFAPVKVDYEEAGASYSAGIEYNADYLKIYHFDSYLKIMSGSNEMEGDLSLPGELFLGALTLGNKSIYAPSESGRAAIEPDNNPTAESFVSISPAGSHSYKSVNNFVDLSSTQTLTGTKTFGDVDIEGTFSYTGLNVYPPMANGAMAVRPTDFPTSDSVLTYSTTGTPGYKSVSGFSKTLYNHYIEFTNSQTAVTLFALRYNSTDATEVTSVATLQALIKDNNPVPLMILATEGTVSSVGPAYLKAQGNAIYMWEGNTKNPYSLSNFTITDNVTTV